MKRAPYRKSANSSDNAASCVGTRGPMHQVERMERKKREEEVRRPWRGSGRGYIVQSGEIVKRHGSSIKAARGGRYPQTGRGYTTRGRRMTVHGRRWRMADGLFNGSRFWRPANRVIEYSYSYTLEYRIQVKVLRTGREPTRKHQSTGSESDSRPPFFALILPNAVFRLIHAIAVYFNHHHKQKHKINKIK